MPDYIATIVLGIIEGLTEFLPVSSTGHLLIAERWLAVQSDLFNTVIQCGPLLAVLLVFWRRAVDLVTHFNEPANRDYVLKLAVAFGVTGVGGLLVKEVFHLSLPKNPTPVALATLVGGVLILIVERALRGRSTTAEITWTVAIAVGLAQLLAGVLPGTSRSGATILIALAFGVGRPMATEFSFLVGIPTMFAASGREIFKALRHSSDVGVTTSWGLILLGTVVAAVTAFGVVKWLLKYVQTHTFTPFGWYRIALGAVILWIGR